MPQSSDAVDVEDVSLGDVGNVEAELRLAAGVAAKLRNVMWAAVPPLVAQGTLRRVSCTMSPPPAIADEDDADADAECEDEVASEGVVVVVGNGCNEVVGGGDGNDADDGGDVELSG